MTFYLDNLLTKILSSQITGTYFGFIDTPNELYIIAPYITANTAESNLFKFDGIQATIKDVGIKILEKRVRKS